MVPWKVYLLGSGEIAIPLLHRLLVSDRLRLVGVGTQPDRPVGRKRQLQPTALGAAALAAGRDPERIPDVNAPEFLAHLKALAPDVLLVASFGQLLKDEILNLPGCRCVNVHASLLPKYRGASPIAQAILNGDGETGVGFMQMVRALDAGPVYRTCRWPLDGSECADTLELKLGELAAAALEETLDAIASGKCVPVPQDESRAVICRKLAKSDGRIDWRRPAVRIAAQVRAFVPWPGACCTVVTSRGPLAVKVLKARALDVAAAPGEVVKSDPRRLIVGCGDGALEIQELAPAGGRGMDAAGFLNGLRGETPVFPLPDDPAAQPI